MLALFVLASLASPPTPLAVVKKADAETQKLLQSETSTVESLARKAEEYIDFGELAKRALGKEWSKLDARQQAEFSETMKGLLRASYAQKAVQDGKAGAKLSYGDEAVQGDEAVVKTSMQVNEDALPVVYKLFRVNGLWKIYDVITDDVSLVSTYQDQFRQVISKRGFSGLLASLKSKREQLEKGDPDAGPR